MERNLSEANFVGAIQAAEERCNTRIAMQLLGISKTYAIAATGGIGFSLCAFGVKEGETFGSLWLNLGSGFTGAFFTYLLFDTYIASKEETARVAEQLLNALHGDSHGLKNYLLADYPKEFPIRKGNLYGANLARTEWNALVLIECAFAFCNFDGAIIEGCIFERCVFTGVSFKASNAVRCICRDCTFVDCDWTDSLWPDDGFCPPRARELIPRKK